MNEAAQRELDEVVRKHLPASVGELLKAELTELERLRTEVQSLRTANAGQATEIRRLQQQLVSANELTERETKVAAREAEVAEKDRNAKVVMAELRATEAEARAGLAKDLFTVVFRNHMVSQTVMGKLPVAVEGSPGGNGNYPSPGFVSQGDISTTTTTTKV